MRWGGDDDAGFEAEFLELGTELGWLVRSYDFRDSVAFRRRGDQFSGTYRRSQTKDVRSGILLPLASINARITCNIPITAI